jgi:hypothetical protein
MTPRRLARALALLGLAACLATGSGCARRASSDEIREWNDTIRRLEVEQDSLRARAAGLIREDPNLADLPTDDVVIRVPTSFLRGVIERVMGSVVENVTLRLSGIKAHVAKPVKKIVTIGEFVLDVEIHEVLGKLTTEKPDLEFGDDRIAMSLPINVIEGAGRATLRFQWDGKRLAGVTCGDLDVTKTLTATVIPARYVVSGSMAVQALDNRIVCTPDFPETRIRLQVKPTQAAWDTVHALLAEKHGVCGWVLDKVNVPRILEGIIQEKGINVKLPVDKIRPFTLPAGVQDTLTLAGRMYTFNTRTNVLRVEPAAVVYGADIEMTGSAPADTTGG